MSMPISILCFVKTEGPRYAFWEGMAESINPIRAQKPGAGSRLPGYEQKQKSNPVRGQDRLSSSSRSRRARTRLIKDVQEEHVLSLIVWMSSGRLFLDRVARQHGPSPLHRHAQIHTPFSQASAKGDISILPAWDISTLP